MQDDAPDDLMMLSQPPGVGFDELPGYAYSQVAGAGVTAYVIDSGADEGSIVSTPIYAKSESDDIRSG